MTILSVGKITPHPANPALKSAELSYDGRTIGSISASDEGPGKLDLRPDVQPSDIEQATALAQQKAKASLSGYANELFQAALARDSALGRMRRKLRKNTLFATPGQCLQAIARPYCERIRSQIKTQYPDAVILNTLSEDEAFRHFHAAR